VPCDNALRPFANPSWCSPCRSSDFDGPVRTAAAEQCLATTRFNLLPIRHCVLLVDRQTLMGLCVPPPPSNALRQRASTFCQSIMVFSLSIIRL
jgi:hypothetical protein